MPTPTYAPAAPPRSAAPAADRKPASIRFETPDDFRQALLRRVEDYFTHTGLKPRDNAKMYLKSAVVLTACAAAYLLLLAVAGVWWQAIPAALLFGVTLAAAAFNIQHDGSHGAYSDNRWINKAAALTLDLLGGSSYIWARKHNSIHHSFTNITGHDDDIDVGFLGRLSPHQKLLPFHRLQHFYLWFLYGLLPVKWHFFDDFHNAAVGRIGAHKFPRPKGWDLATFITGKIVFFSLALALPMLLYPWWRVLALYGIATFVLGVLLSVVFQLAHCVEEAEFPLPTADTSRIEATWAIHQVETTVDFAPASRVISWLVGGLNFQVEHHLLPQVCHVHYPALSKVVAETCRDFGLKYRSNRTFLAGLASHYRWLRRMGRPSPA